MNDLTSLANGLLAFGEAVAAPVAPPASAPKTENLAAAAQTPTTPGTPDKADGKALMERIKARRSPEQQAQIDAEKIVEKTTKEKRKGATTELDPIEDFVSLCFRLNSHDKGVRRLNDMEYVRLMRYWKSEHRTTYANAYKAFVLEVREAKEAASEVRRMHELINKVL